METQQRSEGALTEFIDKCRQLIGSETSVGGLAASQYNEEATRDTIRHYAWGIMDFNPLWLDDNYARSGRFGGLVAPPTFLYSVMIPLTAMRTIRPASDVRWTELYAGTSWKFERPIHVGEQIHVSCRVLGAELKTLKSGQRSVLTTSEVRYLDHRQELLATAVCPAFLIPAHNMRESYEGDSRFPEGSERLVADLLAPEQARRGAEPLFWEDVTVGQEIPELPKGRLRLLDIIRWNGGTYGPSPLASRISASGHRAGDGHYIEELAKDQGLPGMYDNGPLRGGWLGELVCNWMGDWGDLESLSYRLGRFNLVGDVNTGRGMVASKPSPGTVDLEIWIENHRAERTAVGRATVRLPRRDVSNSDR